MGESPGKIFFPRPPGEQGLVSRSVSEHGMHGCSYVCTGLDPRQHDKWQCLSQIQLRGDTATGPARDSPLDKKLSDYMAGAGEEEESWLPHHLDSSEVLSECFLIHPYSNPFQGKLRAD